MIGIRDVACYLPEGTLHSADLRARLGFKPGFLEDKVGVEIRRISAPDESTSDMAVRAFERLRTRCPGEGFEDVGLLLFCTQNPDFKIPNTASLVQHRLGLPKSMLAFDIALACSGYVASIVTAKALMTELGVDKALVFTADPYSKIIDPEDRTTVALFGDAATVTVVQRGGRLSICKSAFGNDGGKYDALIVPNSGTAKIDGAAEVLRLDGRSIYELLKTEAPPNIRACAAINGLTLEAIDLFLFHQASAWLLRGLLEDLGLPAEKVPTNLRLIGNTVSSSIPLLLDEVMYGGGPLPRTMLMSGFGAGLAWASVVLRS
ncbi:ketoacyl-ACP synthase III [Candidatus Binatia bacterium]|nr:ketoacyl-ACP synthase III [Candidatus Binatia bacterium]